MPRITDPSALQSLGNPTIDYAGQKASVVANADATAQGNKDVMVAHATLPVDVAKTNAAADAHARSEHEIQVSQPITPDKRAELRGDLQSLNVLDNGINKLQGFYDQYFKNQGLKTPLEYAPSFIRPENGVFDDTANGLSSFVSKGLGLTSRQFDTPGEQKRFVGAYLPNSSDTDAQIQNKLDMLRGLLDNGRKSMKMQLDQFAPKAVSDLAALNQSQATPLPNVGNGPPPGSPPGGPSNPGSPNSPLVSQQTLDTPDQIGLAQGGTQIVNDPTMAGVNDKIRSLIAANKSASDIVGYMNSVKPGLGDQRAQDVAAAVDFRQKHPEVPPANYAISVDKMSVPMSATRATVNSLAQTGPGTALMNFADGATAGAAPNLAPNPAQARAGMMFANANKPGWAIAGQGLGGASLAAGLEYGAGALGVSKLAAPVLADAAYGGLYGYNTADQGDGLTGALKGMALSVPGGVAGRLATKGIASAVSPNPGNLGPLYQAGVLPTIGQRAASGGSFPGRAVNAIEESLQSLPVVGSMVKGARDQANEQAERGAFNSALSEINDRLPADMSVGTSAHGYMQNAFKKAYDDARSGMVFVPDQQYQADRDAFMGKLGNGVLSADQAGRVSNILDNAVTSRLQAGRGSLSGDAYKAAASDISDAARKLSASDPLVSDALNNYGAIFDSAARRNSAPESVAKLDAADAGYAKAVRIEQAAAARGGDTGRFTANQFDRSVQQATGGVRSRAYLRGDALMQDYADAWKSMRDRLPNSGTTDRLLATQAATGAAGGVAGMSGLLSLPMALKGAAVTLPYAPGARTLMGMAFRPRPGLANAAAKIRNLDRLIASGAQSPLLLAYGSGN